MRKQRRSIVDGQAGEFIQEEEKPPFNPKNPEHLREAIIEMRGLRIIEALTELDETDADPDLIVTINSYIGHCHQLLGTIYPEFKKFNDNQQKSKGGRIGGSKSKRPKGEDFKKFCRIVTEKKLDLNRSLQYHKQRESLKDLSFKLSSRTYTRWRKDPALSAFYKSPDR